jgi:hypothetical protein
MYQEKDGFKTTVKESLVLEKWERTLIDYPASLFNSFADDYSSYSRV